MDNIVKIRTEDSILEEAGEWIAKMDRGMSDAELQALKVWMKADEQHTQIFLEMARLWDKMSVLEALTDVVTDTQKHSQTKWWQGLAAAFVLGAALLLISGINVMDMLNGPAIVQTEQLFKTDIGETSEFTLSDNSVLKLNTQSLVKVTYTNNQRVLELEQGELHIDVAHDKSRPLSVYAAGKIIQAVGTAFNVQLFNNQLELMVTEGKVLVAEQGTTGLDLLNPTEISLPSSSLQLTKGEWSLLSAPEQLVEKLPLNDLNKALSWQQGKLIFRGETLKQAMQEVSRYSGVSFRFSGPELEQIKIAGSYKTNDLNNLLVDLQKNFGIRHQRRGDKSIYLELESELSADEI